MAELSPAAQAVLDAVTAQLDWDARYHSHEAAAALRALATCVEPVEILTGPGMADPDEVIRASDILTIAAELESLES